MSGVQGYKPRVSKFTRWRVDVFTRKLNLKDVKSGWPDGMLACDFEHNLTCWDANVLQAREPGANSVLIIDVVLSC